METRLGSAYHTRMFQAELTVDHCHAISTFHHSLQHIRPKKFCAFRFRPSL